MAHKTSEKAPFQLQRVLIRFSAAAALWTLLLGVSSGTAFAQPRPLTSTELGRPDPARVIRPIVDQQALPQDPARQAAPVPRDQPAADPNATAGGLQIPAGLSPQELVSPQGLNSTLKIMLLLTVLSLAPSILMMTTCFIRFVVIFGLLRQALGTQQLPPNQVIISLSLFMTFMVMGPIWTRSYEEGVRPYTSPAAGEAPLDQMTALTRTVKPLREFMSEQIDRAGNAEIVWLFLDFQKPPANTAAGRSYQEPKSYDDVPLLVLLPAYMLSELKVAFLIGFQLYLPFLVIDMVISSVLISMGMMMLPPVLVSLPFKLLLFVMIDGWFLTVGMMLESVRPMG